MRLSFYKGDKTVIEVADEDESYFINYFDLNTDYEKIYNACKSQNVDILSSAADFSKGIRILRQNNEETLFSFLISQNNFIARIRKTINSLCSSLGEKKFFYCSDGVIEYHSFPLSNVLKEQSIEFYSSIGAGYRGEYIYSVANALTSGFSLSEAGKLSTKDLKNRLKELKGVGPKVADCVALFGFYRTDSFPVDTWLFKVYKEDFRGSETNRDKINKYFTEKFGKNAGVFQQYLFYYKRSLTGKKF